MLLFYLPALWPGYNPILDEHIFYILAFAFLGAVGAGRVFGLDAVIEKWRRVKEILQLAFALG